jgi:hypothetical protein
MQVINTAHAAIISEDNTADNQASALTIDQDKIIKIVNPGY